MNGCVARFGYFYGVLIIVHTLLLSLESLSDNGLFIYENLSRRTC